MGFFPYAARPFQEVAWALVEESAEKGTHLVLEMPTGSGKTVVLLAGVLAAAKKLGKRVLYVSRTNSQQEQTIREFNAIQAAASLPLRAVALQGRHRLCLKLEETADPEWGESSPEELSHFCSAAKTATDHSPESPRACRFYAGLQAMNAADLATWTGPQARTAEWLKAAGKDRGICPYEATKKLLPEADLVVAPYLFALDLGLRRRLMEWWQVAEPDIILVVDEAHNVPEYIRELYSPRLTREKLRRALSELKELGNPELQRGITGQGLLEALAKGVETLVTEYCKEEDGFVPPFELESHLLERFATTTTGLRDASHALTALGEIIKDRRRLVGKIPRSHLTHVASFLRQWLESDEEGYVKLAGREPSPYLEAYLVDTARMTDTFTKFHASVHASGTLDPLEEYRDSLGLDEETRLEKFPSPFPQDRLKIRAIRGVSTRYESLREDPKAVDAIQEATRRTVEAMSVNGACFFPSHRLMQEFWEVGVFQAFHGTPLLEARGLQQSELMDLVTRHRTAPAASLLVGVLGGRLSEGLDFPGKQLEAVIVVGMPYPKPTAHQRALFHWHESRHGKGWDYAVRAPALRRLRQALGRLIRSDTDHGFAIVLDERAAPLLSSAGIDAEAADLDQVLAEFRSWQQTIGIDTTFKSDARVGAPGPHGPPA